MSPRRISEADGQVALATWRVHRDESPRSAKMTAVRWTLEELEERHPGRAVEVRVPPAGAVQIFSGTTHRRGTPPAVVEMNVTTWLDLVTGAVTWEDACTSGLVQASGNRADLGAILPLFS